MLRVAIKMTVSVSHSLRLTYILKLRLSAIESANSNFVLAINDGLCKPFASSYPSNHALKSVAKMHKLKV